MEEAVTKLQALRQLAERIDELAFRSVKTLERMTLAGTPKDGQQPIGIFGAYQLGYEVGVNKTVAARGNPPTPEP
ncbi:hypothetical protein D3C81_1927540 [compost metagenome]